MPICKPDEAADFQNSIKNCAFFFFLFQSLHDSPCPCKVYSHCFLPLWALSLWGCCFSRPALLLPCSAVSFNSLGDWVENAVCLPQGNGKARASLKEEIYSHSSCPPPQEINTTNPRVPRKISDRDPWVAQRFGACLWPRVWSWRPGLKSHVGLPVHGACFSLCLCLCLSLSLSLSVTFINK